MKTPAHLVGLALASALAFAGLGSGCASSPQPVAYHQPAQDFEIVESSAPRALTDSELAEVRSSVAAYLDREGATDGGDYFLKVYLTPENADAASEWVVVRFTRYTAQRVAVVNSYPYNDLLYSPYYSYDLYPYGYGCVSRISFQYYVDPFYGRHYPYYPRHGYAGHKGDHHDHGHDTANNHGSGGGSSIPHGGGGGHGPQPPAHPRYGGYGGGRPGVPLAENENPVARPDPSPINNSGSGLPRAPRVPPTRWTPPSGNVDYRPIAEKPAIRRPNDPGRTRQPRPEGAVAPSPRQYPARNEARMEPSSNRPAPGYRPPAPQREPRAYQPPSPPARTYQNSPAQTPRPSYQPSAPRTAPPSGSNSRQGGDSQKQENLR
jgi:hypothetical protein